MNAYDLANELAFKSIEGDPSGAFLSLVIDRLRIQADSIVGLKISWQTIQDENEKLKAEIEALKDALRMKVILNEHAQQSMKEYKELLK